MAFYKKLPTSRSTRVLRCKQVPSDGEGKVAIHCDWKVISMEDPGSYYALSYVWGDPSVRKYDLVCNGHSMKITYNLWAALKEVWGKWPDRKLWVDAVCINQDDIPERNQQVGMMGKIYKNAKCVTIWLGDATHRTRDFFEALEVVEAGGKLSPATCRRFKDHRPKWNVDDPKREFITYLLNAGDDITDRSWFIRAWTLQEFNLSSNAIIISGHHAANFEKLIHTVHEINTISSGTDACSARTVSIPVWGKKTAFKTLFRILAWTMDRKATDPRDKIFSLLSMLPTNLYGFMKPDYNMSIEETFTWACRICIEIDSEMNCLAGAGLQDRTSSDLPSWVVDWRERNDEVYTWQNLSRSLTLAAADPEICRLRWEKGRRLDRNSKEIHIPGVALGRLEVGNTKKVIFLTVFPDCALKHLEGKIVKDKRVSGGPCIKLSSSNFSRGFEAIQQHDAIRCRCTHSGRCDAYKLNDMPEGVETGDWLWTTQTVDRRNKAEEAEDKKDQIPHFHYAIRPVTVRGSKTARFQLVGKTNGLESTWEDAGMGEVGPNRMYWQASFLFI